VQQEMAQQLLSLHNLPGVSRLARSGPYLPVAHTPPHTAVPRSARPISLCTKAAAASPGGGVDPLVIRQNVDKAAKLIDEMLEDVMREMFVAQAAAYITEEAPELEETQVCFFRIHTLNRVKA
jgi:hypothetical protein